MFSCISDTTDPSSDISLFNQMKMKLILDVDTGVDDAQAIMVALAAPHVEVLAITCTSGNTSLENVLRNTLRVLKVCNRLDVSWWLSLNDDWRSDSLAVSGYISFSNCTLALLYRSQCTPAVQSQ